VAGLVIGSALAVGIRERDLPFGAEHDPLERACEVGHPHLLVLAPGGEEGRLVGEIREVGAHHPRARGRQPVEVDVGGKRDVAGVNPEDQPASHPVRSLHRDPAIEASRAEECRIEHVGAVRRPDHDDAGGRVEPVHLGQDLVQRLLPLVVAP
jgi:hypothetical protein